MQNAVGYIDIGKPTQNLLKMYVYRHKIVTKYGQTQLENYFMNNMPSFIHKFVLFFYFQGEYVFD